MHCYLKNRSWFDLFQLYLLKDQIRKIEVDDLKLNLGLSSQIALLQCEEFFQM